MKIFRNGSVFVQKQDMGLLMQMDSSIPYSIVLKVFGQGTVIIDEENRYEFIRFDDKHEVKFFKEQDWIVNYDDVKDLSQEEFVLLGQKNVQKQIEIAAKYNSLSIKERAKNTDFYDEYQKLQFQFDMLREILWFKQGHIKMDLPEEVDYPETISEEKGIKKLFKRFKDKYIN